MKIHRHSGYRVARLGVIQVPEGRRVVAPLSVEENLLLGRYAARGREGDGEYASVEAVYEFFPGCTTAGRSAAACSAAASSRCSRWAAR